MDKYKEIYNNIKNIAKEYNIEVLIPQPRKVQANVLEDDMLSSRNFTNMMDNVFAISIDRSSNNVNPVIIKNRNPCEITEYIKANEKVGLEKYLERLYEEEKEKNLKEGLYNYKFINNFVYLLNKKPLGNEVFWEILENSQLFKNVILNKDNLWVQVGFDADNYSFLRSRITLDTILAYENLQHKIKEAKTNNILEELLKEVRFVDYLENNLKIINFIGSSSDCLEIILQNINYCQKIDLSNLYQMYTMVNQQVNKSSLHFKWFNATIKKLILYSNYVFEKLDESLEVLNEENQQLIAKKNLNHSLHEKLVEKEVTKRMKI